MMLSKWISKFDIIQKGYNGGICQLLCLLENSQMSESPPVQKSVRARQETTNFKSEFGFPNKKKELPNDADKLVEKLVFRFLMIEMSW